MMRVVEQTPDRLRLSNADSFWSKWGFVSFIAVVILVGIFTAAKVIHPTCWSGVVLGIFLLVMLVRELPRNFDTEICFDRSDEKIKIIKHPWLGFPQQDNYSFSDLIHIRVVARKRQKRYPGYYPGIEDDQVVDNQPTIYDIEFSFQTRKPFIIFWGGGNIGATQLAMLISDFLGKNLIPT